MIWLFFATRVFKFYILGIMVGKYQKSSFCVFSNNASIRIQNFICPLQFVMHQLSPSLGISGSVRQSAQYNSMHSAKCTCSVFRTMAAVAACSTVRAARHLYSLAFEFDLTSGHRTHRSLSLLLIVFCEPCIQLHSSILAP